MSKEDKEAHTKTTFERAIEDRAPSKGSVTARAEQVARETGKLNPLVDPSQFGVIRRSLPRFVALPGGFWRMAIGTPIPVKTRIDTTGSMGGNVDIALRVLPYNWEMVNLVLSRYDVQMATGIFGDISDHFVICDPQFEMDAKKIVDQIMMLVPERAGGDTPEDPHYGLFGAAYLTAAYINRIELEGYDFTVSDAPARDRLLKGQLIRIFGDEVFARVEENGFMIDPNNLPTTVEVVQDLLKISHAFFIQINQASETRQFWTEVFGEERVVFAPRTELLPQIQTAIIGLTEGTLELDGIVESLMEKTMICKGRDRDNKPILERVDRTDAKLVMRAVSGIPIGAQAALPNFDRIAIKDDIFRNKTDLWPMTAEEVAAEVELPEEDGKAIKWVV